MIPPHGGKWASLAARLQPDHYCPGAGVLSRGLAALKALDLSLWQVVTPRIAGSVRRQGCDKPFKPERNIMTKPQKRRGASAPTRLPCRMSPAEEFTHLMGLSRQINARIDELMPIVRREIAVPVLILPKSGLRLRQVRPGAFLFEGGRHGG